MTDGLKHLDTALELGRQLARGEKVRLTKECPWCHGQGWYITTTEVAGIGGVPKTVKCERCKGTGRVPA